MTREEKINWVKNASNEELFEQLQVSTIAMSRAQDSGDIEEMFKHMEDMKLCKAELMARLSR